MKNQLPFPVDPRKIRGDFPILSRRISGHPLVYLDNAATTHKPTAVLDRIRDFYLRQNSNIHRGIHALGDEATGCYEAARKRVQQFINAASDREVIFTAGATDAINRVAEMTGSAWVQRGDRVLVTRMEHHSNLLPWQDLCRRRQAELRVIPLDDRGELDLEEMDRLLDSRTRLLAVTQVSNVTGTVNPVREIVRRAHRRRIPVLVDGAQAVGHLPVDVQELDCDFYVFSGHKMYAPMGIGVLYGKEQWLWDLPPGRTGGGIVERVTLREATFAGLPQKLEPGTPNVGGATALAAAVDYLQNLGMPAVAEHDHRLLTEARARLKAFGGVKIYGRPVRCCAALSFNLDGVHHQDAGIILDRLGIAVRSGFHCAQPLMDHYRVEGTLRISFGVYNRLADLDRLEEGLYKVRRMLGENR